MDPQAAEAAPIGAETVKVWDAPTRAFHWTLVVLIFVLWVSAEQRQMLAHLIAGLATLALIVFRLVWGVIGSSTARFSDFAAGPKRTLGYFQGLARGETQAFAGHNPAGGWMVIAMLALLGVQAALGLFANDERGFRGPLAGFVANSASDLATRIHALLFNLILLAIWTHLAAIFFYLLVKRENLIAPMVTGLKARAAMPAGAADPIIADAKRAMIVAGLCALAVVLLAVLGT